jgi:hypothetical protein
VAALAHLAVVHLAMVHALVVHAGGEDLALHRHHFFLVLGMHGLVTQVELVGQLAFVDQHETYRLAGLDLRLLGSKAMSLSTTSTVRVALAAGAGSPKAKCCASSAKVGRLASARAAVMNRCFM